MPLTVLTAALAVAPGSTERSEDVVAGIDKAQLDREHRLAGYTVQEHYTVRNSHFNQAAELAAAVVYRRGQGKTYKVLWRKGPGFLQDRVISRILKEEATLSSSAERAHTLLTSANYAMQLEGTQMMEGRLCYVLALHPRLHNYSLIEGTAWVDVKGFSLVRIEGMPVVSPSFWTGRPKIEREYIVVEGFSFPQRSRATSKAFFGGKSELDVDYGQYSVSKD